MWVNMCWAAKHTLGVMICSACVNYNWHFFSVLASWHSAYNGLSLGLFSSSRTYFLSMCTQLYQTCHMMFCVYHCSSGYTTYTTGWWLFQRCFKALLYMYISVHKKTKDYHLGLLGYLESSCLSPPLSFTIIRKTWFLLFGAFSAFFTCGK